MVLYTHAGPEISVASTKAFTTQLVALQLLAIFLAEVRNSMSANARRNVLHAMLQLPAAIAQTLKVDSEVASVAKGFFQARDFLFLGRGRCYPIALEGEMKHGPIALIDEQMPVVMVLQRERPLFEKTVSNLKEVEARGARVIVVTDATDEDLKGIAAQAIVKIPFVAHETSPLLLNIPLQMLAYHVAVLNGTDVDLPRNLAKSVTVE
jgi:glucosamine--fructose-6-phosphate aminotransferase (isomerizing)